MANEIDQTDDLPAAIPVSLLTGFLGSGKTTLLNRLLQHPDMTETAVLINEFGDVSIDHLLVEKLDEDVVLLQGGCVCCSVRGDLSKAMRDLLVRRADKTIPPFRRLIIETTGLADPAPVVHTLITDPIASGRYRLDGIITTVDALLGDATLDEFEESVKQIAIAERIVITKTDLVDGAKVSSLEARIGAINPGAHLIRATGDTPTPTDLFE
ncbi:MAG: GTP-binding protein, partial [Rhodospirillaceae bacterium]|nr:GTP-binding protein [Rhodospirillaceae bacterium]